MNELPYPVAVYKFLQSVVDQTVDWDLEESWRLQRVCEAEALIELVVTTEQQRFKNKSGKFEYYTVPNGEKWILRIEGELALRRYLEAQPPAIKADDDGDTWLKPIVVLKGMGWYIRHSKKNDMRLKELCDNGDLVAKGEYKSKRISLKSVQKYCDDHEIKFTLPNEVT